MSVSHFSYFSLSGCSSAPKHPVRQQFCTCHMPSARHHCRPWSPNLDICVLTGVPSLCEEEDSKPCDRPFCMVFVSSGEEARTQALCVLVLYPGAILQSFFKKTFLATTVSRLALNTRTQWPRRALSCPSPSSVASESQACTTTPDSFFSLHDDM